MRINFTIIAVLILFSISTFELNAQCGSCNKCDETKPGILKKIGTQDTKTVIESKEDEFEEFSDFDNGKETIKKTGQDKTQLLAQNSQLRTVLFVLFSVILAGIFVRFKPTRHLRVLFMLGFLIYLGFYLGGCPCPISAYQNVILASTGKDISLISMLYFIGLIPITYVFGKVWCGWICHLGTLQELLHIHKKFNFLKTLTAQKIMKSLRWVLFLGLIIQLYVTQTNWFCKIDPFLVAFNFISVYYIGWYLLGLLIITSIFIHRPFCQAACPIGLVLGWISKIPGASVLNYNDKCSHCNICIDTCKIGAISKDNGNHYINNAECNLCGECLDSCSKDAIKPIRNTYKK